MVIVNICEDSPMITITAPLRYWSNGEGGSHFMSLPEAESLEIRAHAFLNPRGFR